MKNKIKILLSSLALVVLAGCNGEEFFELEHPIQDPWQSAVEFEKAAIGVYYAMTGNGGNGSLIGNQRVVANAISDEAVFVNEAGGDSDVFAMYERNSADEIGLMTNVFNPAYFIIGTSNAGLELFMDTEDPFPGDPDKANPQRIRGELYFGRAYAYWSLAKAYLPPYNPGGANSEQILPKRIEVPKSIADANNSGLLSTAEVYDLIVDDLKKAKQYLPESFDPNIHHPSYAEGRATRFAAAALLARVYFQMGNDNEALNELNYLIDQNNGAFDLTEEPQEAWNKITTSDRGKETIWFYQLADGDGLTNNGWKDIRRLEMINFAGRQDDSESSNSSDRTLAMSESFLQKAGWIDGNGNATPAALSDKRYTQLFKRVAGGTDPRFNDINSGYLDGTGTLVWNNRYYLGENRDQTSVPMFRMAEMYLTRAIIRFNNNDLSGAAADLNMVRVRAWDESAGGPYVPVTAANITAEMIHNERMIELAFEGDRVYYLQALQQPIPNGDRGAGTISWDDDGLYFPIREREKEVNQSYQ